MRPLSAVVAEGKGRPAGADLTLFKAMGMGISDLALGIEILRRAGELGVPVRALRFVSSRPAEDICRVADAKHASLVLLGWHKPLLGRTILGGVVRDVHMRGGQARFGSIGPDGRLGGPG